MGAGASFPDEIDKEMFDSLTDNMFPPQLWKVKCHNYGRYVSGDKKLQVNETEFYLRMKSGVYTFSRPLVRKWDEITANFIDSFFPTYKQNCPFRDSYYNRQLQSFHGGYGSHNPHRERKKAKRTDDEERISIRLPDIRASVWRIHVVFWHSIETHV
jgi:hypothetical protein